MGQSSFWLPLSLNKTHPIKFFLFDIFQAIEKIQERENDLKKLLDGELRCLRKKPKMDEKMQNEAFEKYLALFYNRSPVILPESSDEENAVVPEYNDPNSYIPDVEPYGFFGIDHESPMKHYILEDEKDTRDEECLDMSPPNRIRALSLPIINEAPSTLDYDKNAVLEDSNVELQGERTALCPTPSYMNKPKKKLKGSSGAKKIKYRSQKEIIVGKCSGSYPLPHDAIHEVSRESTEEAMVEGKDGEESEAILIAPDCYIPNSVVAALFDDMRSKEEAVHKQDDVIPYRPPQLTQDQLMEIKASSAVHNTVSTL